MKKFFQYFKIVFLAAPWIIYYQLFYMLRFARNPKKYPLEYRFSIIKKYFLKVLRAYGVDFKIYGYEKFLSSEEKRMIISNHLSTVDPIVYLALSDKPIIPVSKMEAFKYPFIGTVLKALEAFSLDRSNVMKQIGEIKRIVSFLKSDVNADIIIFPEGTRQKNPAEHCLDFHTGTFKIASMAGVKIVPVCSFGSFRPFEIGHYLRRYPIWINYGEPRTYESFGEMNSNEIASFYKKIIDDQVDKFREEDKKYVYNSKVSLKRKALETLVDISKNS